MRRSLCILLLAISMLPAMAAHSASAFIPLDSPFYDDFDTLMIAEGLQPSRTRPYTYGEAALYLEALEGRELAAEEQLLYRRLCDMAGTDNGDGIISFGMDLMLQPEIYVHTNTGFADRVGFLNEKKTEETLSEYGYENSDKYMLWDRERPHFLDLDLALSFADRVTLLFRFPVTNTVHTGVPSGSRNVMTNLPFLASPSDFSTDSFQDFSMNFPYRAHISIADSWYSILIGRERLEYGAGATGNFIIDSSLPYHNALSVSFFTPSFKYTFLLSFFPHPSQYLGETVKVSEDGTQYITDLVFDQNTNAFTGTKLFMSHRFEWTMNSGRHRFAITEGIIYQNDKGFVDLQVLNPMMFFHNMYIAGNANSMIQGEWDVSLAKGVSQHIAFAVDDLNIPFEQNDGSEKRPSAIGLQYGIDTSHSIGSGFLESRTEITYMSPYFYLRDGKDAESYPLDFVIAIRNQRSGYGIYDLYTIGYPNGGDQWIAHLSLSYRVPQRYKAAISTEYRAYGRNNLMTVYMKGDASKPLTHSVKVTISGEYHINSSMKVGAGIEDIVFFNFGNEPGKIENDLRFRLSFRYTL